jgi:hypothetical protein
MRGVTPKKAFGHVDGHWEQLAGHFSQFSRRGESTPMMLGEQYLRGAPRNKPRSERRPLPFT